MSDRSHVFKAVPLAGVLRRLELARAGVTTKPGRRNVHRFRVETARVRVWLEMAGLRALEAHVRRLRKRASLVRTLDVQMIARTQGPAQRRRRIARAALATHLAKPSITHLFRTLAALPPLDERRAARATRKLARQALALSVDWKVPPSRHALRRKLRRLRYALEWQGRSVRRLIPMQDALGVLNDLAQPGEGGRRHKALRAREHQAAALWRELRPFVKALRH